jgi:hypothetical protein
MKPVDQKRFDFGRRRPDVHDIRSAFDMNDVPVVARIEISDVPEHQAPVLSRDPEKKRLRVGIIRFRLPDVDILEDQRPEVPRESPAVVIPGAQIKAEAAIAPGNIPDGDPVDEVLARQHA